VLVTLVILRLQLPHQALAVLSGVNRATITRAVHEVRPLLAARGFAVPDAPGVRLTTSMAFGCGSMLSLAFRLIGTHRSPSSLSRGLQGHLGKGEAGVGCRLATWAMPPRGGTAVP
jgi:Helix-turn-helix of DDE superfamily endonuclease